MQLNKRIVRMTLSKPHIRKIHGVWEVFPAVFKSSVPGSSEWNTKARQYVQRMNCREMMKYKNLEMFRND